MRSERVSVLCLIASSLVGLMSIAAWKFDVLVLASFIDGTRAVAPLTALSFVLSSLAAYCADRRHRERHPRLGFVLFFALLLLCACAAIATSDALSLRTSAFQSALISPKMRLRLNADTDGRTSLISALCLCLETMKPKNRSSPSAPPRRSSASSVISMTKGILPSPVSKEGKANTSKLVRLLMGIW